MSFVARQAFFQLQSRVISTWRSREEKGVETQTHLLTGNQMHLAQDPHLVATPSPTHISIPGGAHRYFFLGEKVRLTYNELCLIKAWQERIR